MLYLIIVVLLQTFLPSKSFNKTAKILDRQRLGKQRVEAHQILTILEGKAKSNAWKNHPAVKMWTDNIPALKCYITIIISEWITRGYKNNMTMYPELNCESPSFITKEFKRSHKFNLLRKDFNYYYPYFYKEVYRLQKTVKISKRVFLEKVTNNPDIPELFIKRILTYQALDKLIDEYPYVWPSIEK